MLGSSQSPIALFSLSFFVATSLFPLQGYLPVDYSNVVLDPPLTEPSGRDNPPERHPIHGISLVTSFWALPVQDYSQATNVEHRKEIEAAMLANLQNHHLRQVVVVLDSVSNETIDCRGFVEYMNQRLDNFTRSSSSSTSGYDTDSQRLTDLQCIERESVSGQPNYLEMFQYAAFHPSITSDIVILSNADQVFDETVSYATQLPNRTMFVLSTHGYEASRVPTHVRQSYRDGIGDDSYGKSQNRCHGEQIPGETTKHYSLSWDAYVFHRSLLRESLRSSHNDSVVFQRKNFYRKPMAYYMNELAAEWAALHDVASGLGANVSVWNACKVIRSWHFHLASKTHHGNDQHPQWPHFPGRFGGGYVYYEDFGSEIPQDNTKLASSMTTANVPSSFVPPPYVAVPLCAGLASCFRENQDPGVLLISRPQRDAAKFVHRMSKGQNVSQV